MKSYNECEASHLISLNRTEEFIVEVIKAFSEEHKGFRILFCGGWIRDKLLNIETKDIDIIADFKDNLDADIISNLLTFMKEKAANEKMVFTQKEKQLLTNGTCEGLHLIQSSLDSLEIDFREWRLNDSLENDKCTRDFRCNALYYNPISQKIIDLCDGMKDIENRLIRTVGDFQTTFKNDTGRYFRLIRFAIDKNFKIDFNLKNQILNNNIFKLSDKGFQNKYREFGKLLKADAPHAYYDLMSSLNLYRIFHSTFEVRVYETIKNLMKKMHAYLESKHFGTKIKQNLTINFNRSKLFCYCEWLALKNDGLIIGNDKIEKVGGKSSYGYFEKAFNVSKSFANKSDYVKNCDQEVEIKYSFPFLVFFLDETEIKNIISESDDFSCIEDFFSKTFEKFVENINSFSEFLYLFDNRPDLKLESYINIFFDRCSSKDIEEFVKHFVNRELLINEKNLKRSKNIVIEIAQTRYESRRFLKKFWDFFYLEKQLPVNYESTWKSQQFFNHFFDALRIFESSLKKQPAKPKNLIEHA